MDKELKRLVTEILSMILLLIIVIPICVHASNNYQMKKRDLLQIILHQTMDLVLI